MTIKHNFSFFLYIGLTAFLLCVFTFFPIFIQAQSFDLTKEKLYVPDLITHVEYGNETHFVAINSSLVILTRSFKESQWQKQAQLPVTNARVSHFVTHNEHVYVILDNHSVFYSSNLGQTISNQGTLYAPFVGESIIPKVDETGWLWVITSYGKMAIKTPDSHWVAKTQIESINAV